MNKQSHSSLVDIPLGQKLREWSAHFVMRLRALAKPRDFDALFGEFEEYDRWLRKYVGKGLHDVRMLEIGFGARPNRLIALSSMGIDVRGVDLDTPMLKGSPSELLNAFKKNGVERTIKSAVRFYLFDWHERYHLNKKLKSQGHRLKILPERFIVSDASSERFYEIVQAGSLDLILSEDVFEHIPKESLESLVPKMAAWLRPEGIALVRPCIYTGIVGGHDVEWYPHRVGQDIPRRSEPWEHLRKRRFPANTYMNELTREDYRQLFRGYFDILAEIEKRPDFGREYLTPEVRRELARYSDDELLSNEVLFVLRPKQKTSSH